MCISNEQVNDVIEAMSADHPMMPEQLLARCEAVSTFAELAAVTQELDRRGYVVFGNHGVMLNETLGVCEDCGLVDHHLLGGECEKCRATSTWITAPTTAQHAMGGAG